MQEPIFNIPNSVRKKNLKKLEIQGMNKTIEKYYTIPRIFGWKKNYEPNFCKCEMLPEHPVTTHKEPKNMFKVKFCKCHMCKESGPADGPSKRHEGGEQFDRNSVR